jgi:cytochrome c
LIVPKKYLFRLTVLPLGIALLLAGLFFVGGNAQSQTQTTPIPTVDRLAEPTLPPVAVQADRGAQVYWLSCMPCHGDKGQGLTNEFRATYPPEEQYCWARGCHGAQPYENGFRIPQTIPALIGSTTLWKFSNGLQLHTYIRTVMPFWKPGSLSEDDAWKVTAFILRANGLWDGAAELNETNAESVLIPRGMFAPTAQPQRVEKQDSTRTVGSIVLVGSLVLLLLVIFILKKSRNTTTI